MDKHRSLRTRKATRAHSPLRRSSSSDVAMSPPPPHSAGEGGGDGGDEEAKAAGFVVFSGIAMGIVKALAFKPPQPHSPPSPSPSPSPSPQEKPVVEEEPQAEAPECRVVEIASGDTLWGLSRRYGVSIDSIRKVNGITGDTIYAGKKLIIP